MTGTPIRWICHSFEQLSTSELYAILRLRSEVFVVEQNCPYQDLDNKDQASHHLAGYINDSLACYARILPPGIAYTNYSSIGRVISAPAFRRTGAGRLLMPEAIRLTKQMYPTHQIKIGAQLYLLDFYQSFGFEPIGASYLEDNIPHISMILR